MSIKRIILIVVAANILVYGVYCGISCIFTTEEDRIRELLENCREIIESNSFIQADNIKDYLTEDFECPIPGGGDRETIPGFLAIVWQRNGVPILVITGHDIEINDETAKANFRLDATFPKGMAKGDHAYEMKVECRKVEGDWKISKADWKTISGADPASASGF